jgi:DNA-directed RNA polymerase II subunit RPB2
MDNSAIWKIIDSHFRDNPQGLVSHHIDSYNDFFKSGIHQIFRDKNPLTISSRFDPTIDDYRSKCIMYFGGKDGSKIYFGKPVIYDTGNAHYMFPNEARLRNMTYGMTIHYDIDIEYIDILEPGEAPTVIGGDGEQIGGTEEEEEDDDEVVGRSEPEEPDKPVYAGGSGKGAPVVKKPKKRGKKVDVELTPSIAAMIREATAQSLVGSNIQRREITIPQVYLGKFPIMVQSEFCILNGMSREMRFGAGECRNDPGGYFIIDGKEKTVIPQEKFGDNMLYFRKLKDDDKYSFSGEIRSVSENVAKPVRTFSVKIVAPGKYTNNQVVVNIPNVRKPVPLFIVFRALGFISDKEIIEMCLLDLEKYAHMIDLFIPSVHDAGSIYNQQTALKYIATLTKGKTVAHALEILSDYFLPHIGEVNYVQKAYYLGYMVFRLLSVSIGTEPETDRDNYKYKRLEIVGSLLYDLFREYYSIQQKEIHLAFEQHLYYNQGLYENNLYGLIEQNYREVLRESKAVDQGFKKAFKGNWGAYTHTKRIGVIQDLNRLSFNSAISHLRKTNLPLDPTAKIVGPRLLHSTQWGIIDPIDTPDGGNIGLHKTLAISTRISRKTSRADIIEWLREKTAMKLVEECGPRVLATMTKVFVNGLWAGAVATPIEVVSKMKLFRRNALIPLLTSITFESHSNTIFVYSDEGRLCRPVFYRDELTGEISYKKADLMKRLEDDDFTWGELVSGFNDRKVDDFDPLLSNRIYDLHELYQGVESETNPAKLDRFLAKKAIIDYIDVSETENTLIALNPPSFEGTPGFSDVSVSSAYTHSEIHESLSYGVMCNQIIFPENNPVTRNSFSCGQSRQAVSLYHTNYQMRMDKAAVVLNSGHVPLVKSRYLDYINKEENPYGQNAIVAIMCYTGYNVEDAMLVNEGALQRGLFRTTYYTSYESHEESSKTGDVVVDKKFTNIETAVNVVGTKPGYDYSQLDAFGLIRENTPVNDKTILVGMTTSSDKDRRVDGSIGPKKGQLGVVDRAFITEGEEGERIAKIRIREERIPAIGDKMASRAGQKGTIGLVVRECDMPFTKDGLRPDIIINPHAIPSRMTIGQLVECLTGKACAMYGAFGECTGFSNRGSKIGVFGELLPKVGFHSSGNDVLYNGMTGEQIESEIFIGPTYYMRLKHMVKDKVNYRALGPRSALTRQTVGGRANDGGLRIGEMERDTVISHGISNFLRESMMERGDKYHIAICNQTGMVAIYNPSKNIFMSPMADGPIRINSTVTVGGETDHEMHLEHITRFGRNFSIIAIPYTMKLFIQELQTMNVQMRIITDDNIQQLENMSYSNNIDKLMLKTKITPKEVVAEIQRRLKEAEKRKDTPLEEAAYPYSPEYANVSPAYQAQTPDYAEGSPVFIPGISDVYPSPLSPSHTPPFPPSHTPPFPPSHTPPFLPSHTPEMSPPKPQASARPIAPSMPKHRKEQLRKQREKDREKYPELAEEDYNYKKYANVVPKYRLDDVVYLKGDIIPDRIWRVTRVSSDQKFITVETEDERGLDFSEGENVKIVTVIDVLDPSEVVYSGATDLYYNEMPPTLFTPHTPSPPPPPPSILFSPTINVVTGEDNTIHADSNEQFDAQGQSSATASPGKIPMDFFSPSSSKSASSKKSSSTGDDSTGQIDMSKPLIIKKTE